VGPIGHDAEAGRVGRAQSVSAEGETVISAVDHIRFIIE
jgi:hypothetical protein